jgi:hypothetical protein
MHVILKLKCSRSFPAGSSISARQKPASAPARTPELALSDPQGRASSQNILCRPEIRRDCKAQGPRGHPRSQAALQG